VSIVARGAALGHTLLLPEEDRHLHSQPELESRLAVLLAGRAAEQAVFGQVTTGSADDIAQATRLARSMVTEFGMSEKLGPQRYLEAVDAPFLGRDAARPPTVSPETSAQVDAEVGRLVDDAEHRATTIIEANRDVLDSVVAALLESETLEDEALASLLATAAVVRDQMERTEVHYRNQ